MYLATPVDYSAELANGRESQAVLGSLPSEVDWRTKVGQFCHIIAFHPSLPFQGVVTPIKNQFVISQ